MIITLPYTWYMYTADGVETNTSICIGLPLFLVRNLGQCQNAAWLLAPLLATGILYYLSDKVTVADSICAEVPVQIGVGLMTRYTNDIMSNIDEKEIQAGFQYFFRWNRWLIDRPPVRDPVHTDLCIRRALREPISEHHVTITWHSFDVSLNQLLWLLDFNGASYWRV